MCDENTDQKVEELLEDDAQLFKELMDYLNNFIAIEVAKGFWKWVDVPDLCRSQHLVSTF